MIKYTFGTPEGRIHDGHLLEYVVGGNGVFARARREGLEAQIQIGGCEIRGLPPVESYVRLERRVPRDLLPFMLLRSQEVCRPQRRELLFHLTLSEAGQWHLCEPEQVATEVSVRPIDEAPTTSLALIEIHSHHKMQAFFSRQDDEDERAGFRIYGVLGTIFSRPRIRLRIGMHGYFAPVRLTEVFQ